MATVTVSDNGRVIIPAAICRRLGLQPGTQLDLALDGDCILARRTHPAPPSITPSRPEDGYGMLRCELPGERHLADFDVAEAMRNQDDAGS